MTPALSMLLGGLAFLVLFRVFGAVPVIVLAALLFALELYRELRAYRENRT